MAAEAAEVRPIVRSRGAALCGELVIVGAYIAATRLDRGRTYKVGDTFIPGDHLLFADELIEEVDRLEARGVTALLVIVDSLGGSADGGFAIHERLRKFSRAGGVVVTFVSGLASSTASVIAVAGDFIVMDPGSHYLLHGPIDVTPRQRRAIIEHCVDIFLARSCATRRLLEQVHDVDETTACRVRPDIAVKMGLADLVGTEQQARELTEQFAAGEPVVQTTRSRHLARAAEPGAWSGCPAGNLGLVNRTARIISIEEDGKLGFEVIAEDWPFGVGTPTPQAVQTTDGYTRDSGERVSGYTRASTQVATAESAADNLVPNGTSEMGVAAVAQGGVSANGLVKDATNAYAGSWCRELVGYSGSSGTMSLAATNPLPCRVGDIFYASAQIKNSVGSAGGLTISFLDNNLNVLATASTTGTVTTSYALFAVTTAAAPSGTAYVQLTMTGNQLTGFTTYFDQLFMRRVIDTPIIGNQQVTRPNLVAVGQQVSGSSGAFSTNSGTAVAITNFSVTLTTTGRPVVLGILHDGSGSTAGVVSAVSVAGNSNIILILRDGTVVDRIEFGNPVAGGVSNPFPPPGFCSLDTGAAAGSHTYTAQAYCGVAGAPNAILVYYCKLVAYEL